MLTALRLCNGLASLLCRPSRPFAAHNNITQCRWLSDEHTAGRCAGFWSWVTRDLTHKLLRFFFGRSRPQLALHVAKEKEKKKKHCNYLLIVLASHLSCHWRCRRQFFLLFFVFGADNSFVGGGKSSERLRLEWQGPAEIQEAAAVTLPG